MSQHTLLAINISIAFSISLPAYSPNPFWLRSSTQRIKLMMTGRWPGRSGLERYAPGGANFQVRCILKLRVFFLQGFTWNGWKTSQVSVIISANVPTSTTSPTVWQNNPILYRNIGSRHWPYYTCWAELIDWAGWSDPSRPASLQT